MARSIDQVQQDIISDVQDDPNLAELSSTSSTAIWRLITRVVARAIVTLESLWDAFKLEINALIAAKKPHTLQWYREKALAFQLGDTLVEGEDYYDNTGLSPDQIADRQIVAQAAVTELSGILTVKVAKELAGDLNVLTGAEYDAVLDYMGQIKDAGVRLNLLSFQPDRLLMDIDVYYDPQILDDEGSRLDGTADEPVRDAVNDFLRDLPFDGSFIKARMVDALQAVEGVFVPEIRSCNAGRFDSTSTISVDIEYQPYSGFLRIYSPVQLQINYIPHV
jgi:hypothetical protein